MDGMNESILKSTKKLLGVAEDYSAFDMDIIININSAFSTLLQLGLGPSDGFYITGDMETWSDFIPDEQQNKFLDVCQYVYLSVKIIFDPPTSSSVLDAYQKRLDELTWRLNVMEETFREEVDDEEP